jgi:hypothetical protein
LPVISSEDTIYVLIDTDNDFLTGYSSIGMPIGAEKMVEIKGHYGIITQRVIKEWTGSETDDWEWSTGEIIDAAASGSEIELEIVDGDFWIHIVGWNGDEDSSLSFSPINDLPRYISTSTTEGYWSFNSDLTDASGNSLDFTATGATRGSAGGKMGDGVEFDGSGDFLKSSAVGSKIDITADWSMEAWINLDDAGDGAIIFIGDNDGSTGENELSWTVTGGEMQICHNSCSSFPSPDRVTTTTAGMTAVGGWYHVAITWDDSDTKLDVWMNNERILADASGINFNANPSGHSVFIGESDFGDSCSGCSGHGDFSGEIDDIRILNYQRFAFGGGLMISKVVPSTNSITIYNAAGTTIEVDGLELYKDGSNCGTQIVATLAAGATTTTTTCSLNADDAVTLVDSDMDNDGDMEGSAAKEWIIDAVCWNDDDSTIDSDCNSSSDPMVAAGVWGAGTAIQNSAGQGVKLTSAGNNDEAVDDWRAIPEFSTLLMPIASVLLIVGYNYRRKNISEA